MSMTALAMRSLALSALALLGACGGEPRDLAIAELDCRTGLYQSAEGDVLALTPTGSTGYRWRTLDGRTGAIGAAGGASRLGWTEEADGQSVLLGACGDDELRFGPSAATVAFARVPLEITEVVFEHDGLTFTGALVWPADSERAPLAVHVHGSEASSAVRSGSMQYLLAAEGVASFVYDKRGTGRSEGQYTQDFHVLAGDARAALAFARTLAGDRMTSAGFIGASQGGWVAPLAARDSDADFMVVLYGLAITALEEEYYQVAQNLRLAGWGEAEQAKGVELAQAAGVIMRSNFREGFAEFDRLRRTYRDEDWYADVRGGFTAELLPYPELALRLVGPMRDVGTSWDYEPLSALRALQSPQLWMLAADDTEAPVGETVRRLHALQSEGRQIDLAVYPGADHGMVLTERSGDGQVRETGYVLNYYRQIAAWISARDLRFAHEAGAEVSAYRR